MKINKLLVASSIAALALVSTAVAQEKSTAPARETTATTEKMDLKGTWRSTKLIGLDIYNRADEKLGDINEILLDKDGRVKAVVIGVGGFLGMGEHDIAVSTDKLKFVEEPHKTAARADTKSDARTDAKTDRTTTGAATTPARRDAANDWAPDHAVMDATKDQLKAMPQFKYSSYN
jgi:PRC-barrel domain